MPLTCFLINGFKSPCRPVFFVSDGESMDLTQSIILGFQASLQPVNLLYCLMGVLIGTLVGVLPGIGPTGAMAILLPATFHAPPLASIIMLAGLYYGACYGGSTTSILVHIPGGP